MRVKKWKVQVYQDHVAAPCNYVVYATSGLDARLLAFALYGGFPYVMTEMDEGDVDLAKTCTKIVAST
jgi:hypothetical protein